MFTMKSLQLAVILLMCLCLSLAALAGVRTIVLKNWLAREWPRMLLHYDLALQPGEFPPGPVELIGPDGAATPCQLAVIEQYPDGALKRCRLSFYGQLNRGDTLTYTLRPVLLTRIHLEPPAGVTARRHGDALEVTSADAGVRVPAPGDHQFKTPVDASRVPAPIQQYRLAGGQWAGKGWLESDRKISAWSQTVVADGPLYKEYAYTVHFAPEGSYKMRVRVEAEAPLVYVAEEYDMGCATAGKDFFVLSLNEGWKPDTALWAADRLPAGKQAQVRDRRAENDTCVWREALDFSADREHSRLFPCMDWGPKAQWYGLLASAGDAASPFVGVMTLHSGAWRLPDQSISPIMWTKSGQVLVKFRTSINLNGAPQNPFGTPEIDPSLPQTLGRRMWALVLGTRPGVKADRTTPDPTQLDFYRNYYGFLNLDDYKDWVLDWNAQPLPGPRIYGTPDSIQRLKANLNRCPGKDQIKNFSLLTGDLKSAIADAHQAIEYMDNRMSQCWPYFWSHYRQSQMDYDPTFFADSALACKDLPADLRKQVQARAAAVCYLLANPDFNPRGAGVHLGNPNMAINRYMSLPLYAALIADHPRAKTWLDDAYTYTKWKTASNVASGGGTFRENPGYATYGPTLFIGAAAIALRNAGYDIDRFAPLKEWGNYFEAIDTPPTAPRGQYRKWITDWLAGKKVRVLPGFGNGPDVAGGQFYLLLAQLTAKSDPAFAARMMTDWQEAGGYHGSSDSPQPYFWFWWDPDITPTPVQRADHLLAGFGGVVRAHADSPDETYACLRQGYTQSHWNPDQGTFVLYARGVNLCPPTGWGYSSTQGICHDSRICFGTPLADHEHGRVDTNIVDYGFTPSLGYLHGRQTFKKRWDPTPEKLLRNDFDWSRQVLLLRSPHVEGPNYVVVRDSTQGACPLPSWFYQWLTTKAENVTPIPGGVHVEAGEGVKMNITFVEPATPQITIKGARVPGFSEDYTQISLSQTPDAGYLTVFYPYKGNEPTPTIEKLADGLIKVTTSESVDYVFCGVDKPVVFENDLLNIHAYAGAVRVYPDKVLLISSSTLPATIAYKGIFAGGFGPFEQLIHLTDPKRFYPFGDVQQIYGTKASDPLRQQEVLQTFVSPGWPPIQGVITHEGAKTTYRAKYGLGVISDNAFYVKGEAPFSVTHEPGKVTLTTDGRQRIFQMPIPIDIVPAKLLPPVDSLPADFKLNWSVGGWINWPWAVEMKVDGVSVQGGWYDGLMTVGVPAGKHVVEITPFTNPPVWAENAFSRLLPITKK